MPDARQRPVAVVDIGSNSIRLVIYEALSRAPAQLYNEKVMCGLGRTIEKTGRLDPEGATEALSNLERFSRLIRAAGVERLDVVATAAMRDATDGPEFLTAVERRTGLPVRVIAGAEEARLSALGVLSGIPGADGVMGDLGGGSLELVAIRNGESGHHTSLPIGPLRLLNLSASRSNMIKKIDQALDTVDWLDQHDQQAFYPVGGAWRALAKMHMEHVQHPLRVIHHYTVGSEEMMDFAGLISRQSRSSLERTANISRKRLEALPSAALTFQRVLLRVKCSRIVFSAHGLREGVIFDQLSREAQSEDPLLSACARIAAQSWRFSDPLALFRWLSPLFPAEDHNAARLRQAASLLSDIAWRDHPDYRPEQAASRVLQLPVSGIDHTERAFLALAINLRYGGDRGNRMIVETRRLLTDQQQTTAVLLGAALRLAQTLTGGAFSLLDSARFRLAPMRLGLELDLSIQALGNEVVQRRLDMVAKAMGLTQGTITVRSDKAA